MGIRKKTIVTCDCCTKEMDKDELFAMNKDTGATLCQACFNFSSLVVVDFLMSNSIKFMNSFDYDNDRSMPATTTAYSQNTRDLFDRSNKND